MVVKLTMCAEKAWRALNGSTLSPDVIHGVQFVDGITECRLIMTHPHDLTLCPELRGPHNSAKSADSTTLCHFFRRLLILKVCRRPPGQHDAPALPLTAQTRHRRIPFFRVWFILRCGRVSISVDRRGTGSWFARHAGSHPCAKGAPPCSGETFIFDSCYSSAPPFRSPCRHASPRPIHRARRGSSAKRTGPEETGIEIGIGYRAIENRRVRPARSRQMPFRPTACDRENRMCVPDATTDTFVCPDTRAKTTGICTFGRSWCAAPGCPPSS